MQLSTFKPRSMLVTKQTRIYEPRFPVIDAHNHLGPEFGGGWDRRPVTELLAAMDAAHVSVLVDLDGGWGEDILDRHLHCIKAAAPDRFRMFGGVDWSRWPEYGDEFGFWAAERLQAQVQRGADGLKIWKPFGLHIRDQHQQLVSVDDPRLDPLWAMAGKLNIPVLAHVADPAAFFEPLDETNERWEELHAHPDWQFPSPSFPPFLSILEGLASLVMRHPGTDFIGAHVGCYAENLAWVSALLKRCPNFYIDISARMAELGRQPYTARQFFLEHADRILFGIDAGPDLDTYRQYYRFLETDDEYFCYAPDGNPSQGRWCVYGLFLPDAVLEQVYMRNAERVVLRRGEGGALS